MHHHLRAPKWSGQHIVPQTTQNHFSIENQRSKVGVGTKAFAEVTVPILQEEL